jgi:outer membrane protein TolC
MNFNAGLLLACSALVLVACDRATNRASPERLGTLMQDGLPEERETRVNERLTKVLARENSVKALADAYGNSALDNPSTVDLATLLQSTLERNPDIGRAAQAINRADAKRLNAIFGYLPQLSASFTQTELDQNVISSDNEVFELGRAQYPVVNLAVELRQPIFDLSRIFGIQLASTVRSNAEISYLAAVQRALYETFDAYLQAAQSKLRSDALRQRGMMITRQVNSEVGLTESGLTDEQASRSLRAELQRIAGDGAIEDARFAEALSKLSFATGTAISDIQQGSVPRSVMGTERRISVDEAIKAAQANNPALLSVAIGVVERNLARKQAIAADFMPVVNAFATLEQEDRAASRFGGGSVTRDTSVGVRLTLPILNASGRGYSTFETNVDLREALLSYHAQRRQIATDINATLERMAALSTAMGQLGQAASTAQQNASGEADKLNTGDSTEVQVVARELLANQLSEQADYQELEYLRAYARLQFLTGAMSVELGN